MTFSFALPKSTETLSLAAGFEGDAAPKSGVSEGTDGFADLLNQLAAVTPFMPVPPGEPEAGAERRQAVQLPTGKTLPLSLIELPVAPVLDAATEDAVQGAQIIPLVAPAVTVSLIDPAALTATKSDAPVVRATPHTLATDGTRIATANAADTVLATKPFVPAPARTEQPQIQQSEGLEVRIIAAKKPHPAQSSGVVPALQSGEAKADLSAPEAAGRRDGTTSNLPPQAPVDRLAQAASLGVAAAKPTEAKAATGPTNTAPAQMQPTPTPAAGDKQSGDERSASERHASSTQTSPVSEANRAMPQAFSTSFEETMAATRPVAAAPRTAGHDQFANVERVVEHLMAARQMDLSKPAAIAVAHKEFGALTVTFDQSAGGMNVEIAADNHEAQRALAAAMANDRGSVRQQDTALPSLPAQNHPSTATSDRAGNSGNSGMGTGHGSGSDGHRPQHSEQRGRHGESASARTQSSAQKPGDDALYA